MRLTAAVRAARPPWLQDVVPAYASVGVFFDADRIGIDGVIAWLETLDPARITVPPAEAPRSFTIPVCYDEAPDLPRVCAATGLRPEQVIALHSGGVYTVYAVGFVPGFAYLGYLPSPLAGVGRLPTPRPRVEPGSVGIAGRQTAVYPAATPGGWNLIGRTPLVLVDLAAGFFPLRVGDRVRFVPVGADEYHRRWGERLQPDEPVSAAGGAGAAAAETGRFT